MMDSTYSYLGYSLIFLLIWAVFNILQPNLRRRMLIFSLVIMPLGPWSEFWFLKDYWRRPTITSDCRVCPMNGTYLIADLEHEASCISNALLSQRAHRDFEKNSFSLRRKVFCK
jgi:hypothetical protein